MHVKTFKQRLKGMFIRTGIDLNILESHTNSLYKNQLYNIITGALYMDGTSGGDKIDDSVPPGGRARYVWNITNSFAPTADDDNCLPWAYHSHVIEPRDVDTGLVGLLVICKRGRYYLTLYLTM